MMSKTKKWIACLVAALLVLQTVPAYMDGTPSAGFSFSGFEFRAALDIGSDESTTALAGSKITLRANEDYTPVWTSGDESKATVESSEPTHSVTVAINEDADDYVEITATAGDQSRTIRINIENPTKYNDGQKTNDGLTNIVIMVTGKTEAVTYDGQEHVLTGDGEAYTLTSNNSGFDSSKVSLVGEPKTMTKKDCGLYALGLTDSDFKYNDEAVKATFIIKDAYLKINAKKVTVKPNDVKIDAGKTPELTAQVSGLVEGESEDLIHYTLSTDAGDYSVAGEYTITAELDGEEVQGNYRVNCKQTGKLTVTESEWIPQDLYNIAKIGGDWCRLRRTTILAKKDISAYVIGLANTKQREVDRDEYEAVPYDFDNEVITYKNKEYHFQGDLSSEELDPTMNYYTVQYEIGDGKAGDHQVIFAAKNKIGGGSAWLIPVDDRYDTPNETDCFKRNYIITLNNCSGRKYTITFMGADGEVLETQEVENGKKPNPTVTPTKEANAKYEYVFTGWDPKIDKVAGNATYTAQFEEIEISQDQAEATLMFDVNGGTAAVPEAISGEIGQSVVLPDLSGTKNGEAFIGWADVSDIYAQVPGTNHRYHDVYKPGTSYTLKAKQTTLYAIYNPTAKKVRFGVRVDGVIQDEPNNYDAGSYKGHFELNDILKEGHWVIDLDSTKSVNDYYVVNDVTANLNYVPTAEQIKDALLNEGNIVFDPETQYIHWYVLKCVGKDNWHVDGVIRNKASVEITYNTNVPGTERTKIQNMPGSYQVAPGTDILIGTDKGKTQIKRPARDGYFFMGWNTKEDGSGDYYNENTTVHLTRNLNLYAQWISTADSPLEIRISSDWSKGKVGYVGAKITLTATLTGFEGKEYTLQWQYSTDLENWVDIPGAHEITYTYILDEITTNYSWRCIARDIR